MFVGLQHEGASLGVEVITILSGGAAPRALKQSANATGTSGPPRAPSARTQRQIRTSADCSQRQTSIWETR